MKQKGVWRYLAVAIVFSLVCVIYLGRLFYIQISGRDTAYDGETTTREVTVKAVRGQIYDRNGRVLVSNAYSYDLTVSASAFAHMTSTESNGVCIKLMNALVECGVAQRWEERYFPFEGQYPYYSWSSEIEAGDTLEYYRLRRVLGDLHLEEDTTAKELTEYYVKNYDLLSTDSNGNRRFSDDEVDRIIHLRYDMDARRFGSADYCVIEDVDLSLMTYVKELSLSGVTFTVEAARVYNYPGYASHILGTVGPIYAEEWEYYNEQGYLMSEIVGKTGCEYAFEKYLRGTDGIMVIEEDAAGNIVSIAVKEPPVAGNDVYLTIDIELQKAAEDGLAENVAYVVDRSGGYSTLGAGCNAGAAVAMDPDTFEVLAIASHPTYDLNTYNLLYNEIVAQDGNPLINRALNGAYAPGSTYKLGVAVAAMMEGQIGQKTLLECTGTYQRYNDYQPKCSTVASHRGHLNVIKAISDSCNCFFYELGYRLGIEDMNEYMTAFGFGEQTGLELGGSVGVLGGPAYRQEIHGELWTEGTTLSAAIGQADNQATPLQLACYLSTLSNGGTRYSAHLLKEVRAVATGEVVYRYEANVLSSLDIPPDVQATVFEGMKNMITSHSFTNQRFSSLPVTVGGKTGTAQTSTDCENALFVAAAPYDDPEVVLSVVLEQGYSGTYASITAARILEQYYSRQPEAQG